MFEPRPKQREVLSYRGGRMGVSAVPGSGKTWTLSLLAAQLISSGTLKEGQEVLIVTLVNSAVDNFAQRISQFVHQRGLLPYFGYRVRTLHGLAHDIVRERPGLVGLSDGFQILDERVVDDILTDVAKAWLQAHPHGLDDYLLPDLSEQRVEGLRRGPLLDLVKSIAVSFIRTAKDRRLRPDDLRRRLDEMPMPLPLAEMGCELYASYQRSLAYRGAVDFDDLIVLALEALERDESYLERLRERWPYILEDEAQDSSRLQEEILRLLTGPDGNWVRVGDPNQAIYETFTTASPHYLRRFLREEGVTPAELPDSGRSAPSIIDLANFLIEWTRNRHPVPEVRDALSEPYIRPAPADDPQPNPPDEPDKIYVSTHRFTSEEELAAVARSLKRWLPDHPDQTVAVLVPSNQRGFQVVDQLRRLGLPVVDSLLRSTASTRSTARILELVLRHLSEPQMSARLADAYRAWRHADDTPEERERNSRLARLLRQCQRPEEFIWPRPGHNWLDEQELDPDDRERLEQFAGWLRRWHRAVLLPIDQLVLALAQDLFSAPRELAIAHKIAVTMRQVSDARPGASLRDLTEELAAIARNERRFIGFAEEETGFDPDRYKGKVVVATMHKAKGLEWDRVYLMSVNNYDFPSAQPNDTYQPEKWFIRDRLNLEAEALAQLEAAASGADRYEEGIATHEARLEYVRERLRLLYVGITRARRSLVITWNTGRRGDLQPALPLVALEAYWQQRQAQEA
ncbi:MAG: ATP-dependent helicase [Anaerolineae bacterium]